MTISSFARLASRLPAGVLRSVTADTWLLTRPVALAKSAELVLQGPSTLELAPGAFLLANRGGTVSLRGITIEGVDARAQALAAPVGGRGFLAATEGGRLWLDRDVITNLGYLGVLSYGITFDTPAPGSGVSNSTITGNYFGIYTTHAVGLKVLDNHVLNSIVYGIDPHTASSGIVIQGNVVTGSGVHGIVLADRVTDSSVLNNVVSGSNDHGIVLFDHSDNNLVQGNTISQTFDGIVMQDSSGNRVSENLIGPVGRFGIRLSGQSDNNTITANSVSHALVGAYAYAGPTGNRLLDNHFSDDAEYVRIRSDAPGNVVQPSPPRSEL